MSSNDEQNGVDPPGVINQRTGHIQPIIPVPAVHQQQQQFVPVTAAHQQQPFLPVSTAQQPFIPISTAQQQPYAPSPHHQPQAQVNNTEALLIQIMQMMQQQQAQHQQTLVQILQRQQQSDEKQERFLRSMSSSINVQVPPNPEQILDSLASNIKEFRFEADSNVTFAAWYSRYDDLFEKDAARLDDEAKVRLLLRKLGASEHERERSTEVNYLYETDKKWGLTFAPLQPSHIFVHSYNEISGWDFRPQVHWDVNFAIDFLISMKETYTTEDARQLSTGQRKCIFPDEVELKYYQDVYTFSGCMKECRMQKCLKYCKCIPPFYAPPVTLPFCTVKQLACLAKYTDNITSISGCQNCELGCHNTVYDIEKYSKTISTDESKEPVVTIEYLTWPIIRYKREVLFGWVDLLVSFGGIAGLFLGFSLLSGVEIIYFFTMRACCMLYKNRDELIAIEQAKLKRPQHRYDLSLRPDFGKRVHPGGTPASTESQPEGLIKRPTKNVITVGLIEQEFQAVKVLGSKGLVLGGASNRFIGRYERMKTMAKPDLFRPILVAPYSEKIKPLDRNVIGNKDGLFYNGYLP